MGVSLPCVAVSPDAIHQHVKTKNEDQRWLHYIAPEYAASEWEGRGGEGERVMGGGGRVSGEGGGRGGHLLSLFAATEITPAADIYAFGLCMLEVRPVM